MQGGLVKTLHPKIHAGILAERNNPAHHEYLESMGGSFIDGNMTDEGKPFKRRIFTNGSFTSHSIIY